MVISEAVSGETMSRLQMRLRRCHWMMIWTIWKPGTGRLTKTRRLRNRESGLKRMNRLLREVRARWLGGSRRCRVWHLHDILLRRTTKMTDLDSGWWEMKRKRI